MTAPVASTIQLPTDTANSGKLLRTQTKSISAQTVHEQFVVPSLGVTQTGKYFFSSTQQSVNATVQDALATGFFWFQVPVAGTVTALIRNILIDCNTSSTTAAPTAPVISFAKFTFTGVAAGAAVTPVKFQTAGV